MGVEVKERHVRQSDINKQLVPGNSLHLLKFEISQQLIDKLLSFMDMIVEYAFGTSIGYALGWVVGFYTGRFYVDHFEPVYLNDLSQLSSMLAYWGSVPQIFAQKGALIGMILGVITIAVIHNKSHKRCISDEHSKHLCYFASRSYHVNEEEDYKDLINEPRYKCYVCGHTANLEESLCNPIKL